MPCGKLSRNKDALRARIRTLFLSLSCGSRKLCETLLAAKALPPKDSVNLAEVPKGSLRTQKFCNSVLRSRSTPSCVKGTDTKNRVLATPYFVFCKQRLIPHPREKCPEKILNTLFSHT